LEQLQENKPLYAHYIKESYAREYIENEDGFITYSFPNTMPGVCVIHALWIEASKRCEHRGSELANIVQTEAKEKGASSLFCEIDSRSNTYKEALNSITNYGFKIIGTSGFYVLLQKEI
jgi:uncharacterized protein YbcC (UPF0753/DUF2309 family)